MARPNLMNHRKFKRAHLNLGIPRAHLRGHLELLWDCCYENGDPFIGDATDVELAAGWEGEPGALFNALLECGGDGCPGLIEEVPGHNGKFQVHDLHDHAPSYVKDRWRKEEGRRQAGKDERKKREFARQAAIGTPQVPEVPGSSGNNLDTSLTPAPAPAPAPSTPPAPGPRKHKRGAASAPFHKPTAEDVQAHLDEIGEHRFTGMDFVKGNDAKGWIVGGNRAPMKDWRAVVYTWRRRRDKAGEPNVASSKLSAPGNGRKPFPEYERWYEQNKHRKTSRDVDLSALYLKEKAEYDRQQ